jgi:RsmE family RNA methyltransferase
VNLLLLEPAEVDPEGVARLTDRRATHLREVLGVAVGARLRAGLIGGGVGEAEILGDDGAAIALRLGPIIASPPPPPTDLLLAVPRPKVLGRVVESVASFGVRRVDLCNAWRVDKSYLGSPRLHPDELRAAAVLGAEQGVTTYLPTMAVHRRFMEALDGEFPVGGGRAGLRLVAHPRGAAPLEQVVPHGEAGSITLAIGPEGGWSERELDTLVARGFAPVSLGAPVLRVEAAIAAALGQLMLVRRL